MLAIAAGAFAITALKHPKGRDAVRATSNVTAVSSSSPKPSVKPSTTAPATKSPSSQIAAPTHTQADHPAVIVLNNTSDAGLTATALQRLHAGGWPATDGGSFDGSILSTAVYYDSSVSGSQAQATALQAQFPAIQRVKEKFSGLPAGTLILILTSDYS